MESMISKVRRERAADGVVVARGVLAALPQLRRARSPAPAIDGRTLSPHPASHQQKAWSCDCLEL